MTRNISLTTQKLNLKSRIITVLDIGSSKIGCLIAKIKSDEMEIIGIGHQASNGLKSGAIIDLKETEKAIGNAVHTAEKMAMPYLNGEVIEKVFVNVSGNHVLSHHLNINVKILGHEITSKDIASAVMQARGVAVQGKDEIIHSIPNDFTVDGQKGIREPCGMFGQNLGVKISAITAMIPSIRNIKAVLSHNHLELDHLCASGYASGLSTLVDDEMRLGCTIVDMGGGTTDIAVFSEGELIFTSAIAVGGSHVTNDIARGLTVSINDAERIKILHGSVLPSAVDDTDMIDVNMIGEDRNSPNQVSKSLLVGIIQPRVEEILELVRAKLVDSGINQIAGRRVVITGGASQLDGVSELASLIMDKKVRLGKPKHITAMADSIAGPSFSTTAGLLLFAEKMQENKVSKDNSKLIVENAGVKSQNLLNKVTNWLKENW